MNARWEVLDREAQEGRRKKWTIVPPVQVPWHISVSWGF